MLATALPGLRVQPVDGLAPLAWCAELRRDDPVVDVVHGLLVEITATGWFEGVWDGPFAEFGFADCATTMGSGAVLEPGAVRFVAPSHTYESLCCIRAPGRIWVSNSIACALALADDEPRVDHPWYHRNLLALQRRGITGDRPLVLPTERGRRLELHAATDLVIRVDHTIAPVARPQPPEPADFAAYRALLASTVARLVDNARDPGRARSLRVA